MTRRCFSSWSNRNANKTRERVLEISRQRWGSVIKRPFVLKLSMLSANSTKRRVLEFFRDKSIENCQSCWAMSASSFKSWIRIYTRYVQLEWNFPLLLFIALTLESESEYISSRWQITIYCTTLVKSLGGLWYIHTVTEEAVQQDEVGPEKPGERPGWCSCSHPRGRGRYVACLQPYQHRRLRYERE